ncbi:helix-turn-helix domain-containing protein [Lactobacillus intestinalis]|nr:LysR family transcriptional regulator [Lactobacillus intestinalis]
MNLNQLYYFKELAKERQFSKAAKNLYISQPSLSNSIKSLEKELNCQLINRNGGQITLTEY